MAVKKAIDSGRITPLPDGTIDPETADVQWAKNTLPRRRAQEQEKPGIGHAGVRPGREMPDAGPGLLPTGGTSLLQARTVNEVLKAQLNKVELAQRKGELVDRAQAVAHVFKLARTERDAWLNWPARISAQMAARLDVDPHALHVALEAAVREHLQELGEIRPRID